MGKMLNELSIEKRTSKKRLKEHHQWLDVYRSDKSAQLMFFKAGHSKEKYTLFPMENEVEIHLPKRTKLKIERF